MKPALALTNALRLRRAYRDLPTVNPALPARADIEPTTYCNFRCPHCPATALASTRVRTHLRREAFEEVLDQLPAAYRLKLVGLGEPLLNPEFFDMVRGARRRRVRVLTTTNGSLLDADRRRQLLTCGLNNLNISVDAATAETHARLRPGSDLEQIGDSIAALMRERGRGKSPAIRVWHVIQRDSTHEIPDLVSRCIDWGVDALLCTAKLTNFGSATLEDYVHERRALGDDLQRVLPEARRRAAAAGLELRCPEGPPPPRKPADGRPCRWPWGRTVVTARGEVLPCPYAGGADGLVLGRLLPAEGEPVQSFPEIWNGPAMQHLREQIRTGRNPAFCRACYPGWEDARRGA